MLVDHEVSKERGVSPAYLFTYPQVELVSAKAIATCNQALAPPSGRGSRIAYIARGES